MQMLCDGHTEAYQNSVEHAYKDGAAKVTTDYTIKGLAHEVAAQLTRQLRSRDIEPDLIEKIRCCEQCCRSCLNKW